MSVIFVFPRTADGAMAPWSRAALQCLGWKRATDLWCAVPYIPEQDAPSDGIMDLEMPPFTAKAELAAAAFTDPAMRAGCTDIWSALWRSVQTDKGPVRGKRHLIVCAPAGIGNAKGVSMAPLILSSRTSLQVISAVRCPALEDLCRAAGGSFHLAESEPEIEKLVARAYLNLLARYDIRYQTTCPGAAGLKVRVHAPTGWGETTLSNPRPA
jgi:hypothetical protein